MDYAGSNTRDGSSSLNYFKHSLNLEGIGVFLSSEDEGSGGISHLFLLKLSKSSFSPTTMGVSEEAPVAARDGSEFSRP